MIKPKDDGNKLVPVKTRKPRTRKPKAEDKQIVPVNAERLIEQAIAKGLPVETMERLFVMRKELKAEVAREAFFRDMVRFQKECPIIPKTKEVHDKYDKYLYSYAPIDVIISTIQSIVEKCNFAYIVKTKQTKTTIGAVVEVHHILGHMEVTEFRVPIDAGTALMSAPQKVASALSFSKRYAICDAFGIVTGDMDDDGRLAGKRSVVPGRGKTEERKTPEPIATKEKPSEAQAQVDTVLDKQMPWLPVKTREMYRKQAAEYITAGDMKNLRGLAASLTKQIALKKAKEGTK